MEGVLSVTVTAAGTGLSPDNPVPGTCSRPSGWLGGSRVFEIGDFRIFGDSCLLFLRTKGT